MIIRIAGGTAAMILGALIGAGPQVLFKVCAHTGGNFMKCHWSAQAEIGMGGLIAVLGIGLGVFSSYKTRLGLTMALFLSGVAALLIPHVLIGGCGMDSMDCRKIAFPAITVISTLLLVGSALYIWYLARREEEWGFHPQPHRGVQTPRTPH